MDMELSETLQGVIDGLSENYSDQLIDVYQSTGDTFIRVAPEAIVEICKYVKNDHHFIYLTDILGADRFTSEERFEVIYNVVSLRDRERLFLKVWLEEENPTVDSITDVWKAANWHERQVYDMFGVRFNNHPDMRRIYMPEDFDYFPLRKEFPLLGIPGSIELPSSTPDTE
ncbi:MAG: NADH-quinone oxidoreductase subunit C [Fodinibius sp.]|nr:NADH-quinone oxidoreductase subunit C [Fodinibius sp.]